MTAGGFTGCFKDSGLLIGGNLQRFVEVTGAKRLEGNGKLLPGGIQVVLHYLYTHTQNHHFHNIIFIVQS